MSPVQILGKGGAMAGTDNIILIGMPGAGKSTLGIVLAKILNYRFLDADLLALAEVENEAVVRDLMYAMRSDYNYIHRNSGDPRGIGHLRRLDHFAVDHHVHVARRLLLHGAHHVGVAVADVAHRDARHQIVIAFPVGGVEERPLGPRDLDEHRRRRGLSHVGEKLFA